MTRETIAALGWLVVGCGGLALLLKAGLFVLAALDWWAARTTPSEDPERLVAEEELVTLGGRVVAVALNLLVGVVWVTTVNVDPSLPPVISLSPIALAVVATLVTQSVLAVFQGVHGLVYRRRLLRRMRDIRIVCEQTTFVDCPLIPEEHRERLRAGQSVTVPVPAGTQLTVTPAPETTEPPHEEQP